MTNKNIKAFRLNGIARDIEDIARNRWQFERIILDQMLDEGYTRVLELNPMLVTSLTDQGLAWEITIQGVYVGKTKASSMAGLWDNKPIPRHMYEKSSVLVG